jgi:plastocyanin
MKMRIVRTLGTAAVLVCALAVASCGEYERLPERPPAKTHTVIMEGMRFRPGVLTVRTGDTIVWVNRDLVPHSATSQAAGFDSKVVAANKSWQTRLERAGDFEYVCTFHPTMTARLQVRDESGSGGE